MALILSIETSGEICSVALHRDGVLLFSSEETEPMSHAKKLFVLIEQVFQQTAVSPKDLRAIAISEGPGSYTGLRIGSSAAKGFCHALNIPLIAIPTLEILARSLKPEKHITYIIPMTDARRMEVYTCVYSAGLELLSDTTPLVLDADSYSEWLEKGKVLFAGSGAKKFSEISTHPNACFDPMVIGFETLPLAKNMGTIANRKFLKKVFADMSSFEPEYLKSFQGLALIQ